ncbi:MAG: SulP family inorganic anion transporter [Cytophagaceae bacterium]
MKNNIKYTQVTGFNNLKKYWKSDILSGFMVFLLALPLSLGVAKASGFPASMGVLSAMIGGLITSFFKVSELTIKGPAAGLITICSGSIIAFGGGEQGWKIASAAIIIMALIQVVLGILRFGSLTEFLPSSVIHGMLAAIGIIIISKQIPVLLGDNPTMYSGESPIELLLDIPQFITHAHWHIAIVGLIGLLIMFGLPKIGLGIIKRIPTPMIVLLMAIPLSFYWHFKDTEPAYSLVEIGDFWGSLSFNFDFSHLSTIVFWKYVIMFLLVSSFESLLTVKAVDKFDPYQRESDGNGDLVAVGIGNFLAGILGALPMISEVVRSSANVEFGAKTKWSNFFHGAFLLAAMLLIIPVIELIPNAALAAMLIFAGYRLASPKQFVHMYTIGKDQFIVFIITIIVTLAEDLLIGIVSGILIKLLIHLYNGSGWKAFFRARYKFTESLNSKVIHVQESANFSNIVCYRKILNNIPNDQQIFFDLRQAKIIDHSFMTFITKFREDYNSKGGSFDIVGLENHNSLSKNHLSTKKMR